MSEGMKLREPSCYQCQHRYCYEGHLPMKKQGVNMKFGDVFCTFGKRARRFRKRDPQLKVPQWCPRRLVMRKLRIYPPEGRHYVLEQEKDTTLTAREFLSRTGSETDGELLDGVTLAVHQVLEIDDGLQPVFFYKTKEGYRYEPFFRPQQ